TLHLWDATTGREVQRFPRQEHWVLAVAFTPDGCHALSGSLDGTVRVWNVRTGRQVQGRGGGWLTGLWGRLGRREVGRFQEHHQAVTILAFHAAENRALSGSMDKTLCWWDLKTGKEIRRFKGHTAGVTSVALAADGSRALSGSLDQT